jgi:cell division protein YceG involved in septum cleavage
LRAALNPASTEYLYYVRNPDRYDGAHNFYSSSAEFEKGVQALRNWERQRDIEEARKKANSPSLP